MARTRGILVDNSSTTVFINIDKPSSANNSGRDALTTSPISARSVSVVPAGSPVKVVTGASFWYPVPYDITVSGVEGRLVPLRSENTAPVGSDLIFKYRVSCANGSSINLQTVTIRSTTTGNTTLANSMNYELKRGDVIFIDVTNVGKTKPGIGLMSTLFYTYR